MYDYMVFTSFCTVAIHACFQFISFDKYLPPGLIDTRFPGTYTVDTKNKGKKDPAYD